MTITALTLTNPGAETGDATGWTTRSGGSPIASTNGPHSGIYKFTAAAASSTAKWDQAIDVSAHASAIDAGTAAVRGSAWHMGLSGQSDRGALHLEAYAADGTTLLDSYSPEQTFPTTWTFVFTHLVLPVNTRFVRFGTTNTRSEGTELNSDWDDFALEISDDYSTDYSVELAPNVHQYAPYAIGGGRASLGDYSIQAKRLGAYGLVSEPSEYVAANQIPNIVLVASEESSGLYELYAHQLGAYALVRPHGDRRELRAWTFKQDDHEFYGVQLGSGGGTLVWDKLTDQWCTWKSPEEVYWRVEDVVDWEGYNLGCDTLSGKVWNIDPTGRLDYDTTPITSVVVGYLTHRLRNTFPCYMAELALSEGQPPAGFDDGTVGITLRTSTDDGQSFVSHGEIAGEGVNEETTVRWYGLGLMKSPGMIFELTDTGYARRIDGLDIEVSDAGN